MSGVIAFVGPSLAREARRRFRGVRFEAPARQGDVWRALERAPRALAIVDGVFETEPSVWHHEIRAALASGVAVFGASSMGALRAAELSAEGMVGVGEVYQGYVSGRWSDDDAVALLHARAEHDFRPLTVPWVTLEDAVSQARRAKVVTTRQARALLAVAKATHFHERHWPALYRAAKWPVNVATAFERWKRVHCEDIKARDARACLDAAVAFARSGAVSMAPRVTAFSSRVREARLVAVNGAKLLAKAGTPSGADETKAGLRTLLLAGWARSMGVQSPAEATRACEAALRKTVPDAAERARLADIFALEAWVLKNAHQMWADGPRQLEGLALEQVRQAAFAKGRRAR
ncbi:MAG: hypothetical protein K1X64_01240 [Myxococcaceae bacterium]|nr:hypothetical protein [Myxococcaceae bacterium]